MFPISIYVYDPNCRFLNKKGPKKIYFLVFHFVKKTSAKAKSQMDSTVSSFIFNIIILCDLLIFCFLKNLFFLNFSFFPNSKDIKKKNEI